ncbi:IS30 family transposase, partial [Mycoplasmopsis agassizii]
RSSYKNRWWRRRSYFSKFKNKYHLPIWLRPNYINYRRQFGHWEIDLIIGKKDKSSLNLITFTERMTRKSFSVHIKSKEVDELNRRITELINENNLTVRSITVDNGLEFSKLDEVAKELNIIIYVCQPYA